MAASLAVRGRDGSGRLEWHDVLSRRRRRRLGGWPALKAAVLHLGGDPVPAQFVPRQQVLPREVGAALVEVTLVWLLLAVGEGVGAESLGRAEALAAGEAAERLIARMDVQVILQRGLVRERFMADVTLVGRLA